MAQKKKKRNVKDAAKDIQEGRKEPLPSKQSISVDQTFSTGSTLLDLACTGGRKRGGGIPPGIIVEIYGPSSAGKTAVLSELSASVSLKGGDVKFLDPEGRLDREYCEIFGLSLTDKDYERPDTVKQVFDKIWSWKPSKSDLVNMIAVDSLAALSTEMEMGDGDSMGMRRAKEFSEGLRKTCRVIANQQWIVACSNQERGGTGGTTTTGGKGVPYYASLRIRITPDYNNHKIKKTKTINEKKFDKIIGVRSNCEIKKSSVDEPFRTAPISIIFGYGIDDIRDQLQWFKDVSGEESYNCFSRKIQTIERAIKYVEDKDLQAQLRDRTIDTWLNIREAFRIERQRKARF